MTAVFRFLLICGWLMLVVVLPVSAQTVPPRGNVVLVADHVYLTGQDKLTAEGNVEAIQGDIRLNAPRVIYDGRADKVIVEGPIRMTQGDLVTVIADYAELDSRFRNAMLRSARMVLDQQLQLATNRIDRIDGRYNVMLKTAVTSCRVCNDGSAPLWQIRASRVVHDQLEKQIYFDDAQFRVLDIPVFYLPQLRLPDPTNKRAAGFLIPEIHQSNRLGLGVRVPYFIPFGDHKDLTLAPFLSSNSTTLEYRYRQAFRDGRMEFNGAVADDNFGPDNPRYYLFGEGRFRLPRDYKLSFNLKLTSDDDFLNDYDYSTEDRLTSDITIRRANRDELTRFALLHYYTLRADEDNATQPTLVGIAETERRYFPKGIGGELRLSAELHNHTRTSDLNIDGPDDDTEIDGRDVTRAHAAAWWQRNWTLSAGLRAGVTGQLAIDAIDTRQDVNFEGSDFQIAPSIAAHLRWPLTKITSDGATHVLEPMAQVSWTGGDTLDSANDESPITEFDEGNLLSLSRFPAYDRREHGTAAAVGLTWARFDPDGWQARLSFGQVYRTEGIPDFTSSSGLTNKVSDFLIAGQFKNADGFSLTARGLFDGNDGINKASARAGWTNDKLWLDASYIWLSADLEENRPDTVSEVKLDGRYRIAKHWNTLFDWRYDIATGDTAEAGFGLEYRNECVRVGLSVSRRFASSTNVNPNTNIGFTVALMGFNVRSNDKSYNRTCTNDAG